MNGLETKNIIRRRKNPGKSVIIAVIAAALALAIFLITLISPIKSDEIDINGTPSRGLSFDKTSITSKTYTLVGIGACTDKVLIVQAEKDGMPVTAIGEMAFRGNEKITAVVLPEQLTVVGSSAFAYCEKLETVIFKGNVTQISNSAFRYCESLEEITIPASVSIIAESAFSHCTNLTKIYYGGTMEEWDKIYFGSYWNVYMPEYTVYCTDGEIFVDLYSKYREVL
jgi:hypothetical protein